MQQKPDIRYLNDMRRVLYDQQWVETAPNLELYYMYRGLDYKDGLRYDITVIPFRLLGKEFVKTKGHEHPGKYQELYQVLEGKAIFLMQRYKNGFIEDVYAVKAKKGDNVFIPAFYGHVTINPGPSELRLSNWVADGFQSDYSLFLKKKGACYLAIARKSKIKNQTCLNGSSPKRRKSKIKWIKNKNYGKVPKLRFEEPSKLIPEDLGFLKK